VRALVHTADVAGYKADLLAAVDAVNQRQKQVMLHKLESWCTLTNRPLSSLTVAMWGLAFKPNTDDVRDAPSLELIRALVAAGAQVRAYDPKATHEAQKALGPLPRLTYVDDAYDATEGADVLLLVTEWRPFRRPDFRKLASQLSGKVIFDGRNQYDESRTAPYGLTLYPIGVPARVSQAHSTKA
jgi:UDPglucose 6-dehydrogenase